MLSVHHYNEVLMQVELVGSVEVADPSEARDIVMSLHDLKCKGVLAVRYPQISSRWMNFNPIGETRMLDIDRELIIASEAVERPAAASKKLFFAPKSDVLPDDGILSYVTVESVYDLVNIPERSVVCFGTEQVELMKLLCDHSTLFDIEPVHLSGLPGANYDTAFESAVWALDRVAYAPLINELNLSRDINEQLKLENASQHDRERERVVRKNGSVKPHTDYVLAGASEDEEPVDD